jgi:hypothetical protein
VLLLLLLLLLLRLLTTMISLTFVREGLLHLLQLSILLTLLLLLLLLLPLLLSMLHSLLLLLLLTHHDDLLGLVREGLLHLLQEVRVGHQLACSSSSSSSSSSGRRCGHQDGNRTLPQHHAMRCWPWHHTKGLRCLNCCLATSIQLIQRSSSYD